MIAPSRVLITGAAGRLGGQLALAVQRRGLEAVLLTRGQRFEGFESREIDLQDREGLRAILREVAPEVLIHAAAWTDVDGCERDPARCTRENVIATRNVAEALAGTLRGTLTGTLRGASGSGQQARLVFISSDFVFDGEGAPYSELDPTSAQNAYGRAKVEAEKVVQALCASSLIVRGTFLGLEVPPRRGRVEALQAGEPVSVAEGLCFTPLTTACFADQVLRLALSEVPTAGIRHLPGPESLTRRDCFLRLATAMGRNPNLVRSFAVDGEVRAARPRDCSLVTRDPRAVPSLDEQFAELARMAARGAQGLGLARSPGEGGG